MNRYGDMLSPSDFDQKASIEALDNIGYATKSWVYFVTCDTAKHLVKIGRARRPAFRLSCLQIGCPFQLKMIGVTLGGSALEQALHSKFKSLHHRGEWFRRGPEMEPFIDCLIEFKPPQYKKLPRLPNSVSVKMRATKNGSHEVVDEHMPLVYASFPTEQQAKSAVRSIQGKRRDVVLSAFGLTKKDMREALDEADICMP